MIDHLSLGVSDLKRSAAFYDVVLEPLGYRRIVDLDSRVGFGKRYPEIWLNARPDIAAPVKAAPMPRPARGEIEFDNVTYA